MEKNSNEIKQMDPFRFNDDLVQMKNIDCPWEFVDTYLGAADADKEWNDSPQEAYKTFLNTKSYFEFQHKNALILLGRTGTGKTAILRCLCESVNRGKVEDYDQAVIVSVDDILMDLMKASDDFDGPMILTELSRGISVYMNCHVMRLLVKGRERELTKIDSYLKTNNLYDILDADHNQYGLSKIRRVMEAAKEAPGAIGVAAGNILAIADVVAAFNKNGYAEAYAEMKAALEHQRVLILVDTSNNYDMRDKRLTVCVKALIETCFQFYNNAERTHIHMKISIPSEIHTQILESLPGKQHGNAVVIQWKNGDLLKMLAIRLLRYCESSKKDIFSFGKNYTYADFYDTNPNALSNAKRILHEILPPNCTTSLKYSFDTLAYCIRHTLKKPRELMIIFNYFIKHICEQNDSTHFISNPDYIRDVIHSTQEEMISGALSMYAVSYPGILHACETVLEGRKYCFTGKDLINKLKEAATNAFLEAHGHGYDKDDIIRILLESGLVGRVNDISLMQVKDDDDRERSRENSIQIVKAKFEYQIKGRLFWHRETWYVLHPMCYEHFSCWVGEQTLVYPGDMDDPEELRSVKLKPLLQSTN